MVCEPAARDEINAQIACQFVELVELGLMAAQPGITAEVALSVKATVPTRTALPAVTGMFAVKVTL
jgi:hypothetical protein